MRHCSLVHGKDLTDVWITGLDLIIERFADTDACGEAEKFPDCLAS
jgi:hypothetical protein